MHLRLLSLLFSLLLGSVSAVAQSKTTEALQKKHDDAMVFFFYNNTLRMLNQNDDKAFDELIKDIEKMKFLMIDKSKNFGNTEYKKLVTDYKSEDFEEIVTSRYQGKSFDIYLKEKGGQTKGMVVLVNDSTNLYVLDILGKIALDKVTSLYNTIDQSSEIGKRIKAFAGGDNDKEDKDDKEAQDKKH